MIRKRHGSCHILNKKILVLQQDSSVPAHKNTVYVRGEESHWLV